jgi:hypothetical protein
VGGDKMTDNNSLVGTTITEINDQKYRVIEVIEDNKQVIMRFTFESYLEVVLCKYGGQFATWIRNLSTGSCNYGHYYPLDKFKSALNDYIRRCNDNLPYLMNQKELEE